MTDIPVERRKSPRGSHSARTECYEDIRTCVKHQIQKYYERFPERLGDERSKDNMDKDLEMLRCIIDILDRYELFKKETP